MMFLSKLLLRLLLGVLCACGILCTLALLYVLWQFPGNARLPADCGVVFGAAVHPLKNDSGAVIGSQAGPAILRRVDAAAGLYREGLVKRLLLTGGKGEGMRLSEAAVMRAVALHDGVNERDLLTEDRSTSTEENIRFSQPLTESCATVVGISDRYHLGRIEFLAWRAGWPITTYPAANPEAPFFEAWSVGREVAALLFEVVTGK